MAGIAARRVKTTYIYTTNGFTGKNLPLDYYYFPSYVPISRFLQSQRTWGRTKYIPGEGEEGLLLILVIQAFWLVNNHNQNERKTYVDQRSIVGEPELPETAELSSWSVILNRFCALRQRIPTDCRSGCAGCSRKSSGPFYLLLNSLISLRAVAAAAISYMLVYVHL